MITGAEYHRTGAVEQAYRSEAPTDTDGVQLLRDNRLAARGVGYHHHAFGRAAQVLKTVDCTRMRARTVQQHAPGVDEEHLVCFNNLREACQAADVAR